MKENSNLKDRILKFTTKVSKRVGWGVEGDITGEKVNPVDNWTRKEEGR